MENDIDEVLNKKRSWRSSERRKGDRRQKDGSIEDRKALADVLRAGRAMRQDHLKYCTCSICEAGIGRWRPWWERLLRKVGLLMAFMVVCGCSYAYTPQQAILAVIGEAEGESQHGKEAVACAIHNRGTLQGVYGLHAPRVKNHLYSSKTYDNAKRAVEIAEDQEYCNGLVNGAQYWEGTKFKTPYWAKNMQVTAVIGNQKFFRE